MALALHQGGVSSGSAEPSITAITSDDGGAPRRLQWRAHRAGSLFGTGTGEAAVAQAVEDFERLPHRSRLHSEGAPAAFATRTAVLYVGHRKHSP